MKNHSWRCSVFSRVSATLLVVSVLIATAGCGNGKKARLDATYPVHGKVVFRNGTPITAGVVCFQSQEDRGVSATGTIGPDGSFVLSSFIAGARAPGALPGKHRVIITPPLNPGSKKAAGQSVKFSPTTLEEYVVVKEIDNKVKLTLP